MKSAIHKIALITSGGDAPGMNACVRAVVKTALHYNIGVIGIEDGYQGMIEGRAKEMDYASVNNIIQAGGTILGTARSDDFRTPEGRQKAYANLKRWNADALIVIGGDGSFAGASLLSAEMNIPVIGLPGTIDNDIYGTDHTIGYDTATNTAMEAIDKIRDTANSHHRVFLVEVMGRNAGFIALNSAIASGADEVLVPEEWTDLAALTAHVQSCTLGKRSSIIVVAEGDDAGGVEEIHQKIKPNLKGFEIRTIVLGHLQRGGSPSAFDRILATRLGNAAVLELIKGRSNVMIGAMGEKLLISNLTISTKRHSEPAPEKLEMMRELRTK